MPHGNRGSRNYEKELRDAVKRIGHRPESKEVSKTSESWQKYLIDVLGFNIQPVLSEKGGEFWEKVRNEIKSKETQRPTRHKPIKIIRIYTDPKTKRIESYDATSLHKKHPVFINKDTGQVSFRNSRGQFTPKP